MLLLLRAWFLLSIPWTATYSHLVGLIFPEDFQATSHRNQSSDFEQLSHALTLGTEYTDSSHSFICLGDGQLATCGVFTHVVLCPENTEKNTTSI